MRGSSGKSAWATTNLLQHQPLHLDVVARVAPVAFRIQVRSRDMALRGKVVQLVGLRLLDATGKAEIGNLQPHMTPYGRSKQLAVAARLWRARTACGRR